MKTNLARWKRATLKNQIVKLNGYSVRLWRWEISLEIEGFKMKIVFNRTQRKALWACFSSSEPRAFASIAENTNPTVGQGIRQPASSANSQRSQENILLNISDWSKPWQPFLRIVGGVVAVGALFYKFKEDISADINNLRTELREDIGKLRTELQKNDTDLRTELKKDISDLRTELKKDIRDLRTEIKEDYKELRKEFKVLRKEFKNLDTKFNTLNLNFVKDREKYFRSSLIQKSLSFPAQNTDSNQAATLEQILGLENSAVLLKLLEKEKSGGDG